MSYAGNRRIIDVDSHVIELDDFLSSAAQPGELDLLPRMDSQTELPVSEAAMARAREHFERRQSDPATMAKFESSVLDVSKSGWSRLGAFDPNERSHTLDVFGYELQWILPTFSFHQIAHEKDPKVLASGARVLNRAMGRFCADDERLFGIGYAPFSLGPEEVGAIIDEGFAAGVHTFMIDTNEPDPKARSFMHPDFDPVWARFQAAEVPVVLHVAVNGDYDPISPSFRNHGKEAAPHVGDIPEGLIGIVGMNNSAELFLSAMVFDGVFERHPGLKAISMEHGATWVPSWLHTLDFAARALKRQGPDTKKPSDMIRERVKFAPFAGEPVGWIIDQVGPELLVYASDYPHPEGTRNPIEKFEAEMTECDEDTMQAFYYGNMASVMGLPS